MGVLQLELFRMHVESWLAQTEASALRALDALASMHTQVVASEQAAERRMGAQATLSPVSRLPDDEPCCICHESLGDGEIVRTACKHTFHAPCVLTWAETSPTCPVCRASMIAAPL